MTGLALPKGQLWDYDKNRPLPTLPIHHQETFDGTGYPDGLKDGEIPFIARIIAVADAFDAMTTDRPYRKKRTVDEAIKELKTYSGTQFDPVIVSAIILAYEKGNLVPSHRNGRYQNHGK